MAGSPALRRAGARGRTQGPGLDYLTEPERMKRFYTGGCVSGRITSPGPARPVFRANTDMMLFTTRLRMDPNGKPHIPGSLEVWRNLFVNHPQGKYDGKLTKLAANWKEPDDVLEALFALSRKAVENEPLKIFMAIGDIDRNRATPLSAATVDRLAREYHTYGSQYPLFSESRSISEKSIVLFLGQDCGRIAGLEGVRCCTPTWPAPSRRWWVSGKSSAGSSMAFRLGRGAMRCLPESWAASPRCATIANCSMRDATA